MKTKNNYYFPVFLSIGVAVGVATGNIAVGLFLGEELSCCLVQ